MSRASECAVLAPCHRAAFICALQASGIILPDDSWVASRTGFIKNVLEVFVISIGCGKFSGGKKVRGKNIAVNTIELRNWKWLLLLLFYMKAVLEAN